MKFKTIAAAAVLAACGIAAQAQPAPPPPPGTMVRPMPMQQERPMMREHFEQHMQQRMERRMEGLKRILQITPNQQGAWDAWAAAMRPAHPMMQRHARGEFAALSTPERIDRMRQLRTQRQAEMDRRGDATKVFYAQLTPPQQKAFDEISLKVLKGGRGHRGGHRGW
jgi:Spy/CpxP family protein refolding chaperone